MAKSKEELEVLKQEYQTLSSKLKELSDEEIKQVVGGTDPISIDIFNNWEILPTIENNK